MTTAPTASPARKPASGAQQKLLAFASLIALLIFFSIASPNFLQTSNILAILQATSVNGVLAIAATLVIVTGGIDLSVGTLMTFCAVMAGVILTYAGMPLMVGVLGAIATGAACGTISGSLIAKMKIPPFIATLGMMLILKGLSLVISGTKPIYFNDTPSFPLLSTGSLIGGVIPGLPVPNGVVILFVLALIISWVLNRTVLGRYCFALGSNEEAVRLSGVNADGWKVAIYALAGGICGIAGLIVSSRLNSAQPALGLGYELDAIAAAVIGGTSLFGGRGSAWSALLGILVIQAISNGLTLLNLSSSLRYMITGGVLAIAVIVDSLARQSRATHGRG